MTDIRLLKLGEELLPGYIERALNDGMITIEDAQKAREMKEIADLPEVS